MIDRDALSPRRQTPWANTWSLAGPGRTKRVAARHRTFGHRLTLRPNDRDGHVATVSWSVAMRN